MVVDRLTREDTRILKLERGVIRGHTCKVLVLERTDARPLPTLDELRARISGRLDAAGRLRQRVVPTPLRVSDPVWLDDPAFDITTHVTAVDDLGIEGRAGLEQVVGRLMCERLDRARPLWHLAVVPRLDENSMALIWRLHHCLADGTTSMRIGDALLWDPTPDGGRPDAERVVTDPRPGSARPVRAGARRSGASSGARPLAVRPPVTAAASRAAAPPCGQPRALAARRSEPRSPAG